MSLFPARWAAKYLGSMAILAGLFGLGFVLIQALLIQRFCKLCLIIDTLAILLAVVELATRPLRPSSLSLGGRLAWVGVTLAGVSAPVAWSMLHPPPETLAVPEPLVPLAPPTPPAPAGMVSSGVVASAPVARSMRHPSPHVPEAIKMHWTAGKITVVEITDFECIHCRRTHAVLSGFVKDKGDAIEFVRLVRPLRRHVNGKRAARTYSFAAERGKAEEMADALFSASDLGREGCERLVQSIDLDLRDYRVFLKRGYKMDRQPVDLSWVRALPTIWIQDRMLVGHQTRDALETAFKRAR
jgi:hypothetical protein